MGYPGQPDNPAYRQPTRRDLELEAEEYRSDRIALIMELALADAFAEFSDIDPDAILDEAQDILAGEPCFQGALKMARGS